MFLFTAVILAARSLEPKVSHTWVASIGNGTMSGIKYSHMVSVITSRENDFACDAHRSAHTHRCCY